MTPNIDNLIPNNISRHELMVKHTIPKMGGIINSPRCLNTNIPKHLLMISHHLQLYSRVPIPAHVSRGVADVTREIPHSNRGRIDGTTEVRKGSKLLKSLCSFVQSSATGWDLDELRVELSGKKTSNHVSDFRDEIRVKRVSTS